MTKVKLCSLLEHIFHSVNSFLISVRFPLLHCRRFFLLLSIFVTHGLVCFSVLWNNARVNMYGKIPSCNISWK